MAFALKNESGVSGSESEREREREEASKREYCIWIANSIYKQKNNGM